MFREQVRENQYAGYAQRTMRPTNWYTLGTVFGLKVSGGAGMVVIM
jgi:hypothetical protein